MQHKTSELTGALLDAAVAKTEAVETIQGQHDWLRAWDADHACWRGWSPSRDWRVGGPIIERERIGIWHELGCWNASRDIDSAGGSFEGHGPTPLIAAMRAYVASKFGETMEL